MSQPPAVARSSFLLRGLLRLYPLAWRDRYGDEIAALVASTPLSFSLIVDMVAGAIDARLHPGMVPNMARPAPAKREEPMLGSLMRLRCMGYAPQIKPSDQWLSAVIMIGGTALFALVWMRVHALTGDNPYVDSFAVMPFLAAYLLSLPFTYLKGRSRGAQVVFVGGTLLLLTLGSLAVGFISSRM